MKTSNSFAIAGRLAADAEVKNFSNSSKATVRIAVSNKKDDKTTTGWLNIEAWRKDAADFQNLKKGQLLQFSGFFRPEEYTDKDGKQRSIVTLVATEWTPVTADKKDEKEA